MNMLSSFKNCQSVLKKVTAAAIAAMTIVAGMPSEVNAAKATTVNDMFVSEANFSATMNNTVEPYIDSMKKTGYFTGKEKASLYYETYEQKDAKGTIVISHGMCENLEKYDEMIYYFLQQGYSVYGMEHRGHSRSGRLGADSSQVNVESFSYYIADFKTFLDKVVIPQAGKENLYVFAHSMGGGIATRFLECYPNYFDGAILSAPMVGVNSGSVPPFFAKILSHSLSITPYATLYVKGQEEYKPTYDFENANTTCESRYARAWETRVNNPELQMGGGSYKWLSECYYATGLATMKCQASKVKIPVLLFQAGKDTLVDNNSENTFAKYAGNCTVVRYDNAKHEMYNETDEILQDYLTKVFDFLENNIE